MRLPALLQREALLRFDDLAEALFFYADMRARNESPPSALGHREPMAPTARAAKETYVALVACMVRRSPEDLLLDPEVTPERVELLLRYYFTDKDPPRGDDLEICRRVRNVLRRRIKARGLLTR